MVNVVAPVSPVAFTKQRGPRPGIALALSGGGYRAMLFHLGAYLRLFELGMLPKLNRISSVSGGSITSAKVALEWKRLHSRQDFFDHVVGPIRRLARIPIDFPSAVAGQALPWAAADFIALAYRWALFGKATLRDLPRRPQFLFNATNLETGTLWRFTRDYMADWKVGRIDRPEVLLARAVAASSAFPPVLSPAMLRVRESDFTEIYCSDPRLLGDISLTDGGVYDNLGMETAWKSYRNVLVSDAGGAIDDDPSPASFWPLQFKRVFGIIHGQGSTLRKRQLIASYKAGNEDPGKRAGAYWGIRSEIDNYHLGDALPAPQDRTVELARLGTQLRSFGERRHDRLINWGYAICDAAVRKHFRPDGPVPPPAFPYPGGV